MVLSSTISMSVHLLRVNSSFCPSFVDRDGDKCLSSCRGRLLIVAEYALEVAQQGAVFKHWVIKGLAAHFWK